MDIINKLNKKVVLLDGAFGTQLIKKKVKYSLPEALNIENPALVEEIHRKYVNAGAEIIYANTFGANRIKLGDKYSVSNIVEAGVKIAKNAGAGLVALDIGPIGKMIKPLGDLEFEEAYEIFKEIIMAGANAGADIVVFETMFDLYELKAGILAAKENCNLPIFATMTFEKSGKTFVGCTPQNFAIFAENMGVNAVGINCSLAPFEMKEIAKEVLSSTSLPVIVKANAGIPDENNNYSVNEEEYFKQVLNLYEMGVSVIGGCCGTTPKYIEKLAKLKGKKIVKRETIKKDYLVTYKNAVDLNQINVIGERINPTGKKLLKRALIEKDFEYIQQMATSQEKAGADILDVNCGINEVDEVSLLPEMVKKIQSVSSLPLQIDSANPKAIENALRVVSGNAIINSVNGEEKSLTEILPLAKKYGAYVVGLLLDENGVPESVQKRLKIAEKIYFFAKKYGVEKNKIIFDALTLTVATGKENAQITLQTLKELKRRGFKTVLGISNVSFGLPSREEINKTFLIMAIENGLNLAIINPNALSLISGVKSSKLLKGADENAKEFLDFAKNYEFDTTAKVKNLVVQDAGDEFSSLLSAINAGQERAVREIVDKLAEKVSPMEVIEKYLLRAMNEIGDKFEKGIIFLPELMLSAETAKVGFDEIKKKLGKGKNDYSHR